MKKRHIGFNDLVPVIAFLVIFIFFTLMSYNSKTGQFMMLTSLNLSTLLDQTMLTILVASGTLFVVAQGSIDMSVGVNLAVASVVATTVANATNTGWLMIPICLIVGAVVGLFTGVVVSRFKVSSFMVTIALLIGLRGLFSYIFVNTDANWVARMNLTEKYGVKDVHYIPASMEFLRTDTFKVIAFFVIIIIMAYVFEFTKMGRYSRAIGENETAAKFVGVPVNKIKIIAFVLSGLMAGVGAIFNIATNGSTTQTTGNFLEMRVIMAIFLGGVMVTGGSSAKFYKILLGSFSIQIIIKGLALMNMSDTQISQSVQGVLLLLILFLTSMAGRRRPKAPVETPEAAKAEAAAPDQPEGEA